MQGKSCADLTSDRVLRAGYERFIEIISEASRHIPVELKSKCPTIEWNHIAAIGNILRHAYDLIDVNIIWKIYENGQLAVLRDVAVDQIQAISSNHIRP